MSGNTSETRCKWCDRPIKSGEYCKRHEKHEPTPPEGEAVTEQPNRAHFSLSPVEAHETVAGKENLTMKNFVIAFHVCCETKEQAHQWRMSALQILDQNTHALGYKPDETGDLNCHCSGHADEENGEEEIPLIPAPVVSTAAPEPPMRAEYDFSDGIRGKYFLWQLWLAFKPFLDTVDEGDGFPDDKEINFTVQWKRVKYAFGLWSRLPGSNRTPVAPESYKPAEGELHLHGYATDHIWLMETGPESHPIGVRLDSGDSGVVYLSRSQALNLAEQLNYFAATPVTVEAPNGMVDQASIICMKLRDCADIPVHRRLTIVDQVPKLIPLAATPKPIGDVEAVARQIANLMRNVALAAPEEEIRLSVSEPAIAAILSPFFAEINLPWTVSGDSPSNPPMVWDASGDSIVNQMEDGTPYFEPEVAAFIGKAANSLAAHELECATLQGKLSAVVILLRARCSDKEWDAMPETLAEVLPAECATLRKERDDARKSLESELHYTNCDKLHRERETKRHWQGRADAAEAQLSTLRDALRSIEELALACINTHAHETTCANMDVIQGIAKAALAPTPEVAPKE